MEKITINGVEYKLTPIENESPNSFEPKFKVGDVIFAKSKFNGDSFIRIFLKLDENKSWAYCNICSNGYFDASKGFLLLSRYDFYPATKEQRNLLFTKMKEAGYEWDAEKKELKKIEAKEAMHDKPKFKVGDEIKTANEESLTITKIDEKGYWSKDLFICSFDEECIWDLVEQKPTDKVKPKFKVGDWIVFNGLVLFIKEVVQGYYRTISVGGIPNSYDWGIDNVARLWTIRDAKDGDMICVKNAPFIYKHHDSRYIYTYCTLNFEGEFLSLTPLCWDIVTYYGEIFPATKEQRDFLFSKMNEAGYEWDAENKQLKEIEQKFCGEENERMFKSLNKLLNEASCYSCTEGVDKILSWLKSLKPQNRDTYNPYKEVVSSIAEMCDKYKSFSDDRANDFVNNVKVKCKEVKEYDSIYPQNTWKPSDAQMQALKEACDKSWEPDGFDPLYTLYEQLKKLKGE